MTSRRRIVTALLAAAPLAGCATPRAALAPGFGQSVAAAVSAQIAYPEGAAGPAPDADGPRTALAIGRYQRGMVIAPAASTSQVGKDAAGSGGKAGP